MAWINGDSRTSTQAWRNIRRAVIVRDGNTCRQCGADGRVVRLDCDHIVNVAEGGTDDPSNAQLLCVHCHGKKTRQETARGQQRRRARLKLPVERHPGLR